MATIPSLQPTPAAMPAPPAPSFGSSANVVDQVSAVVRAAQKYGIDPVLLWGVYGVESDFGRNSVTNSKGYTGPFQFGPNEARKYSYPWTNKPNAQQFQAQADAAAHYLSDLGAARNPDAALSAYSGGGYTTKSKSFIDAMKNQPGSGSGIPLIGGAVDAVKQGAEATANAAGDVAGAIGQFLGLITSAEFWVRIGEGIAGLILIAMGLKALTGVSIPLPPVVPV